MDNVAFQGMPRISLTPAEEALIPRPHSSASQVATAIPSTYTRSSTSSSSKPRHHQHPHHRSRHASITHHPYYSNPSHVGSTIVGLGTHFSSLSSASIHNSATTDPYSRSSTPGPAGKPSSRPSSPSNNHLSNIYHIPGIYSSASNINISTSGEQEYPQNPQDSYHANYPPESPPQSASPGLSRLAIALGSRPARSPSPQLHSNLHNSHSHSHSQPSYFPRTSHDTVHSRPGSPLNQGHYDSWDTGHHPRVDSPLRSTSSEEEDIDADSDMYSEDGNNSDDEGEGRGKSHRHRSTSSKHSNNSIGILRRLRESTSRLSFADEYKKSSRTSHESDRGVPRPSQDSSSSASRPIGGKGALQGLSDEDKQQKQRQDSRRNRPSTWRPSLSLIRQESDYSTSAGGSNNYFLQNDLNYTNDLPSSSSNHQHPVSSSSNKGKRHPGSKGNGKSKANKKKRRRAARKRRAEQQATQQREQRLQRQLYEQQLAEQARMLPHLSQVLEKRTRYPLSYDGFETFLRTQRAVEYLNFWADVAAHEQLCRTFDVSERRQKREHQLEERAIARDRRRMALMPGMEPGRLTPDPDLLGPNQSTMSVGRDTGIGVGVNGQEIDRSSMYAASRSSLQLPLGNDHLSFPQETRRYGPHDSSALFPPISPAESYNRILAGVRSRRISGEVSRPSLEDPHISEQDAAVAALAMRAQRNGLYSYNSSREDVRRGSFDRYQSLPGSDLASGHYQQYNHSNGYIGGALSASSSAPNAYNMMMRGRGSIDIIGQSNSRNIRRGSSGTRAGTGTGYDYFSNGAQSSLSQLSLSQYPQAPHTSHTPQLVVPDEAGQTTRLSVDGHYPQRAESPSDLQRRHSMQSLGFASHSELDRRLLAIGRFPNGLGPLQAPFPVRRSGESAYTPSIFSGTTGQEGKAPLAFSFRAIALEDLQESAMRIYRKYLVQFRTASMAAEEEEALAISTKQSHNGQGGQREHNSLEKILVTSGWGGYAEEVITQWNEKWQERRLKRLSSKKSSSARLGNGYQSGQRSVNGDKDDKTHDVNNGPGGGPSINTEVTSQSYSSDNRKKEHDEGNGADGKGDVSGNASVPTSPRSPKMKKRTGTGLSAILNPLFTRLMRTETTVVELPTLTINTTTVEEVAIHEYTSEDEDDDGDDSDDDEADDDVEDEDYDSDGDSNVDGGMESTNYRGQQEKRDEDGVIPSANNDAAVPTNDDKGLSEPSDVTSGVPGTVVILERSIPPLSLAANMNHMISTHNQGGISQPSYDSSFENADALEHGNGIVPGAGVDAEALPKMTPSHKSSLSSLSSTWDRITMKDLEKEVVTLPQPIIITKRPSPYHWYGKLRGIRASTRTPETLSSNTTQRGGWHLPSLLRKSIRGTGSSSSSLSTIQFTPCASPRTERPGFWLQPPSIATGEEAVDEKNASGVVTKRSEAVTAHNNGSRPMRLSNSGTANSVMQLQGEPIHSNASLSAAGPIASTVNTLNEKSTPYPSPQLSLTPQPSSPFMNSRITGSRLSGLDPGLDLGSSPVAVAASAAAVAFYLPLECRQRIHQQVQEGRTHVPHLFGPAKGFVTDVVLMDHYYPLFLNHMEQYNMGILTRHHPNNRIKIQSMIWLGIGLWFIVLGVQLSLALLGLGGWSSPWVWMVGILGGWTGSICLMTGIKEFSPILGLVGKICEDKHVFRFRKILEPSIRIRHRQRAYWMLAYCIISSTIMIIIFAALPQLRG
ncbi:hypothetical protein BX616_003865 [Lobosporangium transversale]|nr:hypothetical protein BX616_003865 [Lobosporangium transversale]